MNESLKKLLSALILSHHNVRILHWKLKGAGWDPVHGLFGDYYDQLDEIIDDVAEITIQLGGAPVCLQEALEILEADTEREYLSLQGSDEFNAEESFAKISSIFNTLIDLYTEVYKSTEIPPAVINRLQEHDYWLRKECNFKNIRRLLK